MEDLPESLWYQILDWLDFRDKLSCTMVNRQLHGLLSKPGLWGNIHVTLENLVGNDNERWDKELRSPAARCGKLLTSHRYTLLNFQLLSTWLVFLYFAVWTCFSANSLAI